jgi:hypothetical protein
VWRACGESRPLGVPARRPCGTAALPVLSRSARRHPGYKINVGRASTLAQMAQSGMEGKGSVHRALSYAGFPNTVV